MDQRLRELAEKDEDQWFYSEFLEEIPNRKVAWIDIMGVRDALRNNQLAPAIWRGELYSVITAYIDNDITEVFSVGDGIIVMCEDMDYLKSFLKALFSHYVLFNLNRFEGEWVGDIWLHRLIRAGVGSGPAYIIDVEAYLSEYRGQAPFQNDYFSNTPFGPALIRAFQAEEGPPFSVHVLDREDQPIEWKWWDEIGMEEGIRRDLLTFLNEYFNWYDSQTGYRYKPYKSNHLIDSLRYFEIYDHPVDPGWG